MCWMMCWLCRIHRGNGIPCNDNELRNQWGKMGVVVRVFHHTITPSPLSSPNYLVMKIQKIVFLLPAAVEVASKRFGVPPLTPNEVFTIYSIQYLPMNTSQASILRHASKLGYPITNATISRSVHTLHSSGLIQLEEGRYSISPLGREYLSSIRRFLINKRL